MNMYRELVNVDYNFVVNNLKNKVFTINLH